MRIANYIILLQLAVLLPMQQVPLLLAATYAFFTFRKQEPLRKRTAGGILSAGIGASSWRHVLSGQPAEFNRIMKIEKNIFLSLVDDTRGIHEAYFYDRRTRKLKRRKRRRRRCHRIKSFTMKKLNQVKLNTEKYL